MPELSVVVPVWAISLGTGEIAEKCLSAIQANTKDYELILIDNGSTIAPENRGGVKRVRNEKNHGVAAAWNQGAEMATGKYLAFINSDCFLDPGWQHSLLSMLGKEYMDRTIMAASPLLYEKREELETSRRTCPPIIKGAEGSCFVIPREVYDKVGPFDERYFCYYEDYDYWMKIKEAGGICATSVWSAAMHMHGASAIQDPAIEEIKAQSREKYIKTWGRVYA